MALTVHPEKSARLRALGTFAGAAGAVVFGTSVVFSLAFPDASAWLTLGPIAGSLAALGFWLSVAYRRLTERLSQRSGVFVLVTTGSALALLALLVGLNWIVAKSAFSVDLTARQVHSLSEQTRKVLEGLDTDVRITAFYERGSAELMKLDHLVEGYRRHSDRLTYRVASPTREVDLAERYSVVESGDRVFVESRWDDEERAGLARFSIDMRALNHEQELTNALMKATQESRPRLYMLTGHNEASADDSGPKGYKQSVDDLIAEGYDVIRLNLLQSRRVPDDAAAVLIVGPRQGLLPPEVSELSRFLVAGGSAGIFLEAGAEHGLGALLQSFGVQANDDIIIDLSPFGTMFGGGPYTAIATEFADHPITAPLGDGNVVFSRSRSLSMNPGTSADTVALVQTGKYAWGETDLDGEGEEVEWNEGEVRGPVSMAVAAAIPREGDDERSPTRLFVAGDSSFASNQLLSLSSNRNMLLNTVGWLTAQDDKIAIRPRSRGANLIVLTPSQREAIAFFVLYVLPVLLLSLGLGIWLVRRQR